MKRWPALVAVGLAALVATLSAVPLADASSMRPLSRAFKRTGALARQKVVAAGRRQFSEREQEEEDVMEGGLAEQEVMTGQGPVGGRRALQRRHRKQQRERRKHERRALAEQEEQEAEAADAKPAPEPMKITMDFQILDPKDSPSDFSTQGVGPEGGDPESHSIFAGQESLLVGIGAAVGAAVLVAGAVLLRRAQLKRREEAEAEERERACLQGAAADKRKRPQGLGSLGAAASAAGGLASARGASGKIVVREESVRGLDSTRSSVASASAGSPMSTRGEFFNLQDIDLQQSPGKGKAGALMSVSSPRK